MAQLDVIHTDFTVQLMDVQRRPASRGRARFRRWGGSRLFGRSDVTDRRSAESQIRHLANYDDLTGLPNRRQLMWRTERALEQAR